MPISTWSSAADSRAEVAWCFCSQAKASIHFCRSTPVMTAVPAAVAASSPMRARSEES